MDVPNAVDPDRIDCKSIDTDRLDQIFGQNQVCRVVVVGPDADREIDATAADFDVSVQCHVRVELPLGVRDPNDVRHVARGVDDLELPQGIVRPRRLFGESVPHVAAELGPHGTAGVDPHAEREFGRPQWAEIWSFVRWGERVFVFPAARNEEQHGNHQNQQVLHCAPRFASSFYLTKEQSIILFSAGFVNAKKMKRELLDLLPRFIGQFFGILIFPNKITPTARLINIIMNKAKFYCLKRNIFKLK